MEEIGGLIASPPQHHEHPDGHAIVRFKNVKKKPDGIAKMEKILLDAGLQPGRDASIFDETRHNPLSHMGPAGAKHPVSHESTSEDTSYPNRAQKHSGSFSGTESLLDSSKPSSPKTRIAKVSMLHDSFGESIFDIAMRSQEEHASIHGYPIHVMRHEMMPSCHGLPAKCNPRDAHNLAGSWNKELYLQSILIAELAKPEVDRVDWLMWQDSDSLVVTPTIPLDVFLPPNDMAEAENVHLIATKDDMGFNAGAFFLRVSPWSVRLLTTCLAVAVTASPFEDLGWSYDQSAMATLLDEDEEFKSGVVWQPRSWYNAYGTKDVYASSSADTTEMDDDSEGFRGKVLNMHFPGTSDNGRIPLMDDWLQRLEEKQGWGASPEETGLLDDIEVFWNGMIEETKE